VAGHPYHRGGSDFTWLIDACTIGVPAHQFAFSPLHPNMLFGRALMESD
jgi:hypothetical protein